MTITYSYGNSLYVNITNRCSNRCDFCVRTQADGFYSDNLWLEREPAREEILAAVKSENPVRYDSIVFCGYGEPTERLDDMLFVCRELKKEYRIPIRLNTNGQSDLINRRRTAPEFRDALDTVSISLNAPSAEGYDAICHPIFGENVFRAILDFASDVRQFVPSVLFSVIRGTIPDSDIEKCRLIAEKYGVMLRVRDYIKENR